MNLRSVAAVKPYCYYKKYGDGYKEYYQDFETLKEAIMNYLWDKQMNPKVIPLRIEVNGQIVESLDRIIEMNYSEVDFKKKSLIYDFNF